MLEAGPALKVSIHLNRDTGAAHGFLTDDILAFLQRRGIEGATAVQAWAGYGAHRQLHTSGAGDVDGLHLPVVIYFIERQSKVDEILDELLSMVTDGLVEAHPTQVLKGAASSEKVIS
jgi:PII-like signaling protein